MPVMIRTHRTLTRNSRKKALRILDNLKNVRSSKREHVFKHIAFVNKLLQDLYFTGHKMIGDDMFKLLYKTLGEQDMSCWNKHGLWSKDVRDLRILTTLKCIVDFFFLLKAYSRLMKSFVISYKRMVNARPNSSSLAWRLPRVASTDKVRKVKDEDLEFVSKSILKTIPRVINI